MLLSDKDVRRTYLCALASILLLSFVFFSRPQNVTLASIDIIKNPMAVSIRWAPASSQPTAPVSEVRSAQSMEKIIHQDVVKNNISNLVSRKSTVIPSNVTSSKANNKDEPLPIEKTKTVAPLIDRDSAQRASAASEGSLNATSQSGHKPNYPRNAIRRQQEGRVLVELTVDELGDTRNVELISSSGYYLLDQSVLKFAKKERFNPATNNGTPVVSRQEFGFVFALD